MLGNYWELSEVPTLLQAKEWIYSVQALVFGRIHCKAYVTGKVCEKERSYKELVCLMPVLQDLL